MKNGFTAGITAMALGLMTILIPVLIFPVCTNMFELANGKTMFMKCHWTAMSELVLGALILIDGVFMLAFKQRETRFAFSIMLFVLGLSVLLMATVVIGMCQSATMQCRIGSEPALIIASILTMLTAAVNIFIQRDIIKKLLPK